MVDLWKEKSLATAGCGMWEMEATVPVLSPSPAASPELSVGVLQD